MTLGLDPKLEVAKLRQSQITLGDVLSDYLRYRTLRPNSKRSFKSAIRGNLGDWLHLPIVSITKEMIESRHRELTRPTQRGTSGKARANATMERLGVLINFAMNQYEIDGEPIMQKNPVHRLSQIKAWHRMHIRIVFGRQIASIWPANRMNLATQSHLILAGTAH